MQNIFLKTGIGESLQAVSAATGNDKNGSFSIAVNGWSEGISAHDCKELCFAISLAAAGGSGNILIERTDDMENGTWETHATIAATGVKFKSWAAGEFLLGFYRVKNSSDQIATVRFNKAVI